MPAIPNIPLSFTAAIVAAAILVAVCTQAAKPLLAAAWKSRPGGSWDRPLLAIIIVLGCGLAPVFFLDMFRTVTDLLSSEMPDAWTVPAATEGAFLFLYILGLWLQRKGKPKAWLRWAPYPFAAASLFLNVYAAHGNFPAMVGHAAVTIAFFLPVLAAEAAVHAVAVTEDEVALASETADARRYALDFVRDQKGIFWRLRVPSLLKRQIVHSRPPAAVLMAVAEGAEGKGAAAWEKPVEDWVVHGLTRREDVAVKVTRKRAEIRAEAAPVRAPEASRSTAPDVPPAAHEHAADAGHGETPAPAHEARTKPRTVPALKLSAARSRSMAPEDLALNVGAMIDAHGAEAVSLARVRRDLHIGPDKARDALALAYESRKGADIIEIGARQ